MRDRVLSRHPGYRFRHVATLSTALQLKLARDAV
jgi:hypothetical protein